MSEDERTERDLERHRAVYAKPGLPPFAVRDLDDRVLAGRNPLTRVDVAELRRRGVTHVLDLREPREWRAPGMYGAEAVDELARLGIERRNVVVPDLAPPSGAAFDEAIAWIEGALARQGTRVFVHCRAGRERTGSILAALLVARGVSLEAALRRLEERCGTAPLSGQVAAVRAWASSRARSRAAGPRDEGRRAGES